MLPRSLERQAAPSHQNKTPFTPTYFKIKAASGGLCCCWRKSLPPLYFKALSSEETWPENKLNQMIRRREKTSHLQTQLQQKLMRVQEIQFTVKWLSLCRTQGPAGARARGGNTSESDGLREQRRDSERQEVFHEHASRFLGDLFRWSISYDAAGFICCSREFWQLQSQ